MILHYSSEIKPNPLCLGNTSKYFLVNSTKKTGFNVCVYNFLLVIGLLILVILPIFISI